MKNNLILFKNIFYIILGITIYWICWQIPFVALWPTAHLFYLILLPFVPLVYRRMRPYIYDTIELFGPRPQEDFETEKALVLNNRLIVKIYLLVAFILLNYSYIQSKNGYEKDGTFVVDSNHKNVCSMRIISLSKSVLSQNGFCSYIIFPHDESSATNISYKIKGDECIDSIDQICQKMCGQFASEENKTQISSFLINFGAQENFSEFHIPFADVKTLGIVSCDHIYNEEVLRSKPVVVSKPEL